MNKKLILVTLVAASLSSGALYAEGSTKSTKTSKIQTLQQKKAAIKAKAKKKYCLSDAKKKMQEARLKFESSCDAQVFGNKSKTYGADKLKGHPYAYKSPYKTCDLGLKLPGLPDLKKNINFDGSIDSCNIVKSIVGDQIDEINGQIDSAVGSRLDQIKNITKDFDLDLEEVAKDTIKKHVK